jgi:hypothetical protein
MLAAGTSPLSASSAACVRSCSRTCRSNAATIAAIGRYAPSAVPSPDFELNTGRSAATTMTLLSNPSV